MKMIFRSVKKLFLHLANSSLPPFRAVLVLAAGCCISCAEIEDGTNEIIIDGPPLSSCDEAITEWLRNELLPGDECHFESTCRFGDPQWLRCVDMQLEVDCTTTTATGETVVKTLREPAETCP